MSEFVVRDESIEVIISGYHIVFIVFIAIILLILQKHFKKNIKESSTKKFKDSFIYNNECPICFNPLKIPVKSECGHAFCIECLYTFWKKSTWNNLCSLCRAPLENLKFVGDEDKYSDSIRRKVQNKLYKISNDSIFRNTLTAIPMFSFVAGIFLLLLWTSAILHIDILLQYSDQIYKTYYTSKKEIENEVESFV